MENAFRKLSLRSRVLLACRLVTIAVGAVIAVALVMSFVANLFGMWPDIIRRVFPKLVVVLVCDACAGLLFRLAFIASRRRDRVA